MAPTTTKRRRRRYSLEQKERGLTALVLAGGSAANAAQALNDAGHPLPRETLRDWAHEHADRYEQLRTDLAPRIADRIASEAEALAVQYAQAEAEALQVMRDKVHELDANSAASAIRNLSTAKALQIDKISSPLRGRPSVIVERRDPDQILREIERIIPGTATEVPTQALPPASADANPRELPSSATSST